MDTTITLKYEWDMGHRLPRHNGKCARLHGHRYVAEIDVTGPVSDYGPGTGMVLDFYIIKQIVADAIGGWDHRTMLWAEDPLIISDGAVDPDSGRLVAGESTGVFRVPFMPTAENISREIHRLIDIALAKVEPVAGTRPDCSRVRVYETPNGWAEVR